MAIQSKARLQANLTESVKRMQQVRIAAEKERISTQFQDTDSPPTAQTQLQTSRALQGKP